jgi:hypothetical protein
VPTSEPGLDLRSSRRQRRGIGRRDAEGVFNSFQQDGQIDGFVDVGNGSGFESGVAIADGCARTNDDNGDGAGVEEHLKALENDETVTCREAEVEEDEVGLFLAGGADGGEAIASGHNFESGGLEASGESRQLEVLVLDDHDFFAGHCDAYPLKSEEALPRWHCGHLVRLSRLCVSNRDITRQIA